jgi:hypothetical protein
VGRGGRERGREGSEQRTASVILVPRHIVRVSISQQVTFGDSVFAMRDSVCFSHYDNLKVESVLPIVVIKKFQDATSKVADLREGMFDTPKPGKGTIPPNPCHF